METSAPAASTAALKSSSNEMKKTPVPSKDKSSASSSAAADRIQQLLARIVRLEQRGAISKADATSLRQQIHLCPNCDVHAVEKRLGQLMLRWNPYHQEEDSPSSPVMAPAIKESDSTGRKHQQQPYHTKIPSSSSCSSSTSPDAKSTGNTASTPMRLNFYQILQLNDPPTASAAQIKRQFRKLALLLHPDKKQQQLAAATSSTSASSSSSATAAEATASTEEKEQPKDEDNDDNETVSTQMALDMDQSKLSRQDSTQFARLRLAYETLIDPETRKQYDFRLANSNASPRTTYVEGIPVKDQIKLEAAPDFASLEWMARVKHKMDVMDRLAEWGKLLGISPIEMRFETGEPCVGKKCGKIVTMDRDLECIGSLRRRVYVCLLHKYVHACDASCTSENMGQSMGFDERVCEMRAFWLVQSWLYEQIHAPIHTQPQSPNQAQSSPQPNQQHNSQRSPALLTSGVQLGDALHTFRVKDLAKCHQNCSAKDFECLEPGIFVCRHHGAPHICTFDQCDRKKLTSNQRFVCQVSQKEYGFHVEEAGTSVRVREVRFQSKDGERRSVEMEVPTFLPLGQTTGYLLEETGRGAKHPRPSASDPHLLKRKRSIIDRQAEPTWKRARPGMTNAGRVRLETRLEHFEQRTAGFYVYLKLPMAVASLPKVALELQDQQDLLQVWVLGSYSVNAIKLVIEDLAEVSVWEQQIIWGDTLIGEGDDEHLTLDAQGIKDGCVLELRLHEDCPLLMAAWQGKTTQHGALDNQCGIGYSTLQISKEAQEDLEEEQEELLEQEALLTMQNQNRSQQNTGALVTKEVLQFDTPSSLPRLVGMVPLASDHKRPLLKLEESRTEDEIKRELPEVKAFLEEEDEPRPLAPPAPAGLRPLKKPIKTEA